ncbi:type II toxin-antitoxin system VapB family antitoxin [Embleya sp. AB8]|uniref:type II toxin-antitoxin system VapB family antitoxin n=1 Tax=Embleya sp. AB8 TaxID=3156304 RepID=UPI003C791902
MSVTRIEFDDETLAEAMRLTGAATKTETLNAVLREYVAAKRLAALEDLVERGRRGEFDQAAEAYAARKAALRKEPHRRGTGGGTEAP